MLGTTGSANVFAMAPWCVIPRQSQELFLMTRSLVISSAPRKASCTVWRDSNDVEKPETAARDRRTGPENLTPSPGSGTFKECRTPFGDAEF